MLFVSTLMSKPSRLKPGFRPTRQEKERNQNPPQAVGHPGDDKPLAVQTKKKIRQGIQLAPAKYSQKISIVDKNQGGDFVKHADKHNWNGDQAAQNHHKHSLIFIDRLEQAVQC